MASMIRLHLWRLGVGARALVDRATAAVAMQLDPSRANDLRAAAAVLREVAEARRRGYPDYWHEALDLIVARAGGPGRLDVVADALEAEARFGA